MTVTQTRELRRAPAMLPLFAKAIVRAGVKPGSAPQLPDLRISLKNVKANFDHLKTYRQVCGFRPTNHLPVTYPHLHAHPLFMSLILDSRFPFAAMGLVHVRNKITALRRVHEHEPLDVACGFGDLVQTDKGYEFSILTTISTGGDVVWESASTMLARVGSGGGNKTREPAEAPAVATETWHVPGNIGRRYGAVSGDRNPIHLYPLTAKLFGFKRQIAHGMWSKARCLAALENDLPESMFSVDVQFKLPVFIPAKVQFVRETQADGVHFNLLAEDGIKPHLSGILMPGTNLSA